MQSVTWVCFESRFTLTWFFKNLKNSNKTLKVAYNMEKKQKYFKCFCIVYLTSPTLGHCQLLLPEKGEEEHEIYISCQKLLCLKNLFRSFWDRKWWLPIHCKCNNISIRASVHLCKFVTFTKRLLVKQYYLLKPYYMVWRLYPLIIFSLSRDYILSFLNGIHTISGCYAFTQLGLVTLLMLFATEWKLNSNE